MSAWVSGPDRGLHPIRDKEDGPEDPTATFAPELISNPALRENAKSSRYGEVVPKVEKIALEANDLRPWEEQPTFAPEMPECALRSKVKSSSYGTAVPVRETRTVESPSFKPELATQTSTLGKQWTDKARSTGYGVTAAPAREVKEVPRPTFTPEVPKNPYREKYQANVLSSKYGTTSPARVERPDRPKTAPVGLRQESRNGKTESPDGQSKDVFAERATPGGFVLDCIRMGEAINEAAKYPGVRIPDGLNLQKPIVVTDYSRKLKTGAHSSKYGSESPQRGEKATPKKQEGRFSFGGRSQLDGELEAPPRSTLVDKAHSQGYGVNSPAKVDRAPPKAPEPLWAPTLSYAQPELPEVPRSKLNDKVASHSYGVASPGKGERAVTPLEPVWVPSSFRSGIPEPEPPRPRSAQYSHIRSHYGADYNPASNITATDEAY